MYVRVVSAFALVAAPAVLASAADAQSADPAAKPVEAAGRGDLPPGDQEGVPPQVSQSPGSQAPVSTPRLVAPSGETVQCCRLPALTPIELEIVTPASSKTSVQGQEVQIRVAEAITVDGKLIIPAGTQGFAEVVQVSKGRLGGKAGELVIGAPYLLLHQQRIGLKRFRYGPSSGANRTGQVIVATAVIGIVGMFISGGNIDIPSGARANAVVTTDTLVSSTE